MAEQDTATELAKARAAITAYCHGDFECRNFLNCADGCPFDSFCNNPVEPVPADATEPDSPVPAEATDA